MKRTILAAVIIIQTALCAEAQDPNVTSWIINTDGTEAQFWVTPQGGGTPTLTGLDEDAHIQTVAFDNDYVYAETQGLAEEMGPCGNPGSPTGQEHIWVIPRNPVEQTAAKTETPDIASIGVLINGVPIYALSDARSYSQASNNTSANGDGIWWGEAYYTEGVTLDDKFGGHPQQDGEYHSHAVPSDLYDDLSTNEHSPIVGWAWDGFPVYGPYAYSDANDNSSSIKLIESSYSLRNITERKTLPDGSSLTPSQWGPDVDNDWPVGIFIEDYEYTGNGDLDEYNGRFCITPEFPDGIYAYFVTMESDGTPVFPYYIGLEYYGIVEEGNFGIMGGKDPIPAGAEEYDPLSIAKVDSENKVTVYPNPSNGNISIQDLVDAFESVEVVNLSGRIVYSQKINRTGLQIQFDLSSLESGSYILKLSGKNLIENKAIVIQ